MKRVIVTGGRDYADRAHLTEVIYRMSRNDVVLVHGGARGADTLCEDYAKTWGFQTEVHPARWDLHGKAAGFIRNQEMIDLGASLVIAFPGGRGTEHCVRRAEAAGIPVMRA